MRSPTERPRVVAAARVRWVAIATPLVCLGLATAGAEAQVNAPTREPQKGEKLLTAGAKTPKYVPVAPPTSPTDQLSRACLLETRASGRVPPGNSQGLWSCGRRPVRR
jgi:hypothetical protein